MDSNRFDQLTKRLCTLGTRRGLLRLVATVPVAGTLLTGLQAVVEGQGNGAVVGGGGGRRRRRKKRHDPGGDKDNRKGKRKGKGKNKGKKPCPTRPCPPGSCGSQPDGCGGMLSCGGCAGNQLCVGGTCRACDVCQPPGACTFSSVQAAINATSPQLATIVVCPGTYVENANVDRAVAITNRSLHLIGAGDGVDPATNTHLTPHHPSQQVMVIQTQDQAVAVTLEGLRLTGGSGSQGRGLYVTGFSAQMALALTGCTITHNLSGADGGGLLAERPTTRVTLTDTHITNNTGGFSGGGGIETNSAQVVLDTLSRVTGNTVTNGPGGINNDLGNVHLPSVDNVTGNTSAAGPNNCGGTGTYTGPGAICTTT